MSNQAIEKNIDIDWKRVARLLLLSRSIDDIEENELVPDKKVLYQFSARGHELAQILLGMNLMNPNDIVSAYYRSRPLLLTLGLTPENAIASDMAKSGGYSNGRDIGVVCNMPNENGPMVLPLAGEVGSQYTPGAGTAQAIQFLSKSGKEGYESAISVICGGDGSVATNGFWSSLTMATTLNLPILFFIEDNGYGISVEGNYQTPGGNIANNLYSFKNLNVYKGSGTEPEEASKIIQESIEYVRNHQGPALLRLKVPRLNGHSYQDNQAYKQEKLLEKEQENDPLNKLKDFLIPDFLSIEEWRDIEDETREEVKKAAESAWSRPEPKEDHLTEALYHDGMEVQKIGGLFSNGYDFPKTTTEPQSAKQRINMVEAIRRTLEHELEINEKVLVFGEDVGKKGGVHAVTSGLQTKFGLHRVFDTSLSEEGIIGRSVGLAYAGYLPVAEIQFRKYADPATEQLKNAGTIRWRTANKFAAPMVVRMPGGFAKCGDPWHSESNESFFAKMIGWQLVMPSNAQDAAGLLRSAMRDNNPTIFFEHRNLLDSKYSRTPYPGDKFVVPIGKAKKLQKGSDLTIITWGAMCERCEEAGNKTDHSIDIIDLRTIFPWDKEMVFESVKKTNRCLIVHEDNRTGGFGGEISAAISDELFKFLDAPVQRLAFPDIPVPYNVELMNLVMPNAKKIAEKIEELVRF